MIIGGACHAPVPAEQPVNSLLAAIGVRVLAGEPPGVQAQQVMYPPPAAAQVAEVA